MKHIKLIGYLLILSTISAFGQSNDYPIPSQPAGNYYDYVNAYYEYLDNNSNIDTYILKQFYRTDYFWGERIGTNGNYLDVQKVALQYSLSPICNSTDAANWSHVGPDIGNITNPSSNGQCLGLINCVVGNVEDQNNGLNSALIGAASAGIWKFNVNTNEWECKTDALRYPGLVVSSIERNPNSSKHNQYIASTGVSRNYGRRYGVGLIKSMDGGDTWSIVSGFPMNNLPAVVKVIYDVTDATGNTIFAITPGSVYKSSDNGTSWTNIDDNLAEIVSYYDNLLPSQNITRSLIGNWWSFYDIQALGNGKFIVSIQENYGNTQGGVWKYDPSTTTKWTRVTNTITGNQSGTYDRARFSNMENGKLFISIETTSLQNLIYKSNDFGSTWTSVLPTGITLGYGNKDVIHYSHTKDVLYLAYNGGSWGYSAIDDAFTSNPNVKTNIYQGHADVRDFYIIQEGNSTTSDVLLIANDGGVTKVTYEDINNQTNDFTSFMGSSLPIGEYFGIGVSQQSDKLITGAMHNHCFKYENGNWNQFGLSDGGDADYDPFDDSKYYYFYGNGGAYLRNDNGIVTTQKNIWFRSPIEIFKKNPDKLVIGLFSYNSLNGGFQIYDRSTNTASTPVRFNDCNGIQAIGINSNDELMYAYHSVSQDESHPKLFITDDEGVTSTNLSANPVYDKLGNQINTLNNLLAWREISDIIFNSENPNEVWIGLSGVQMLNGNPNPGYLRVLHSMDKGQTWTDYSEGLPAFPINTFEYVEHSNGLVFVGTDVGVFYRDHSMLNWSCYSNNLPVAIVTDIDYRKCSNELYISTYGRGIWKSPMNISSTLQDYVINNNQSNTWQFKKSVNTDIVIKSGSVLNIVSDLYMTAGKKIIVEPGAKLVIDGGSISSACDDYWQGIEVWGTSNQSQVPHTNGLSDYQGEVEVINGGTIENAINAIAAIKHNPDGSKDWSKTGGIVTLNGAIFKNNNYDVWIGGYHNFLPSTGREIWNYSKIINSDFENNNDMFSAYNGFAFVGLWDVGSMMIKGNTFKNLKTGQATEDKGIGIIVWSSTVNISDYCPSTGTSYVNLSQSQALSNTPCTNAERNYFEGLYYGIRSLTSNTAGNSIVHIDRAEFNNVYHGIHLLNTDYAVVTRCDFDISNTDPAAASSSTLYDAYGIYLDGCDAYRIEENTFNKYNAQQGIRGIVVDNSGINNNEIYKNYLNDMGYAIVAQDTNANITTGLGIFCNEMSGDYMDITVLDEGIKQHQKITINSTNGFDYFAAGNIFTTCNNNNYQNYYNGSSQSITYYPDANNVPQCHNINIYTGASLNRSCPTKLGGTLSYALQAKADAVLALNSANTIYYIWKDGGEANLENEVETTQPWDVYVQFNELIAESPYISNEVLIATIENPAFTSLMIKLLMIANPHGITNDAVMEAVYNRIPALPQNYIDEILEEEGEISQLEILEANVAACKHEVDKQSNDIERLYRMEMNDGEDATDYISFLSALGTLKSEYKLAELYLELSNYTNMQSVLDAIPNDYSLTTDQSNEYNAWLSYYNIAKAMKQEGVYPGALSETQITQLESLRGSDYIGVAKSALALLMLNNPEYEYNEIVKPVDISSARMAKPAYTMTETSESKVLKVYPNPSYDFITVEYRTGDKYNKLWIEIKDAAGKSVLSKTLEGGNNEELVNTSSLSPNVYTLLLYGDGELLEIVKITVLE